MATYTATNNDAEANDAAEHQVTLLSDVTSSSDITDPKADMEEEEVEYKRHQWSSKREYILSAVGYCVGVGNLWRFPYMCNRNGGGAFLIPFMLSLILCGMPLFFLEAAVGQFSGRSPVQSWGLCPLVKGIGLSMFVVSLILFWYYNTIQAWALYYLVSSFKAVVPWSRCDQWWNTPRCTDFSTAFHATYNSSYLPSNLPANASSSYTIGDAANVSLTSDLHNVTGNDTGRLVTAAEEFWQHNVLRASGGFEEPGHLVWYLVVSLAATAVMMFLGLIKGVRSTGKVVYVTAVAPYVLLTILLVRGATLPGAADGVLFYLKPDFAKLLEPQVWVEAALQVFYSLGPAWGGIHTMASYNKFNNNCLRDSILLTFVCEGTSIFGGFAVFSVLGYMAFQSGVPIDKVVSSGPGLAFIVYPEAISRMPLPQLWATCFFVMILTLCCDSQLTAGETVLTVLCDKFPRTLSRHRVLVTAAFCAFSLVIGLPFVMQGGIYLFQLVDWFIASLSIITIGFTECIVISWVYGADTFGADIQMMIGCKPPMFMKLLWLFVTPFCLLVMFVFTMITYRPPTYGDYVYGVGGSVFGWTVAFVSVLPLPIVAVYQLYKAKGSLWQRFCTNLKPDEEWGPPEAKARYLYRKEVSLRPPRQKWYDVIFR